MVYSIALAVLIAYFLGNFNGAVLVSAMMHDDVRSHGSGNAGLTNFVRNFGAGRALYVIAIDMGKAILACEASRLILSPYGFSIDGTALGALCVILGHTFPILLGFRGGKGILSGVTVALMMDWRIGLFVFGSSTFYVSFFYGFNIFLFGIFVDLCIFIIGGHCLRDSSDIHIIILHFVYLRPPWLGFNSYIGISERKMKWMGYGW